jgi:hypothetical protein
VTSPLELNLVVEKDYFRQLVSGGGGRVVQARCNGSSARASSAFSCRRTHQPDTLHRGCLPRAPQQIARSSKRKQQAAAGDAAAGGSPAESAGDTGGSQGSDEGTSGVDTAPAFKRAHARKPSNPTRGLDDDADTHSDVRRVRRWQRGVEGLCSRQRWACSNHVCFAARQATLSLRACVCVAVCVQDMHLQGAKRRKPSKVVQVSRRCLRRATCAGVLVGAPQRAGTAVGSSR